MQGVEEYIKKSKDRLITATSDGIGNIRPNRQTIKTRKQKREEKQLYGYFKRQNSKIAHEKTWI